MDEITTYLLGYLTEEQWLDAFDDFSGDDSKSEIANLAKQVQSQYSLKFDNEKLQALVDSA